MRRVATRLILALKAWRRLIALTGWTRAQGPRTVVAAESDAAGTVPVVMCAWRRIDRLPRTVELLRAQTTAVSFYVWLNDASRHEDVTRALANAPFPTELTVSSRNIGGFGRFYLGRRLAQRGFDRVVFIDDDQEFGPEAVSRLVADFRPRTVSGWWAFRFSGRTVDSRTPAGVGEAADYVGTGGMIADTRILLDERVFQCPRRFWFVEDFWLCYVASRHLKWTLFRSGAEFAVVNDANDLFRTLGDTKNRMLRMLARDAWPTASALGRTETPGAPGHAAAPSEIH